MILLHRFQEQPKLSRPNNRTKQQQQPASMPPYRSSNPNTGNHQRVRWGPQGQMAMQASSSGPDKAEIARLQAVIANMTGRPGQYASTGMPSAPDPYSDVSLLFGQAPLLLLLARFMGLTIPTMGSRVR